MYSSIQVEAFIHNIVNLPNPAKTVDPVFIQQMMRSYRDQQVEVYFMTDQYGVICQLGNGVELLTGFPRDELLGIHLCDFIETTDFSTIWSDKSSSLCSSHRIDFFHRNGEKICAMLDKIRLHVSGSYEGILKLSRDLSEGMVRKPLTPLLSLSISGSILSANTRGDRLLAQWQCQLGSSSPDWMQDQALDTWCAKKPLSFGSHVYLPLAKENIILLSDQPFYEKIGDDMFQLSHAGKLSLVC